MKQHARRWAASAHVREAYNLWTRPNVCGAPSLEVCHKGTLTGLTDVSGAFRQRNVIRGITYLQRQGVEGEKALDVMQDISLVVSSDGKRVFRSYLEFAKACVVFNHSMGAERGKLPYSERERDIQERCMYAANQAALRAELVRRGYWK